MIGDYDIHRMMNKERDNTFRVGQVFLRVLLQADRVGNHGFTGLIRCSFFNLIDLAIVSVSPGANLTTITGHDKLEELATLCDALQLEE